MGISHISEGGQTKRHETVADRQTSGRPELVIDVALYRRGNVWQCRTGILTLFVTPESRDDWRWSVVALDPGKVPMLINKQNTIKDKEKISVSNNE